MKKLQSGALLGCLLVAGCTMDGNVRDPFGNAAWSLTLPGSGQFMNQRPGRGAAFMALGVGLYAAAISYGGYAMDGGWQPENWLIVGSTLLSVWSAVDAYHDAVDYNKRLRLTLLPEPGTGSPALAMQLNL